MMLKTLIAAIVAAVPVFATPVSARDPAPLLPVALVEDVKSATADVEFMDYVGNGKVIKLAPRDVLVLSYLKSCEHETITGGIVTVGLDRSDVRDGRVLRAKVPCDGGQMRLSSAQASQSAATAFRLQSADIQPTLYARAPVVQLPNALTRDRILRIERTDRPGERREFRIDDTVAAAGFYDLAKINVRLTRGATYDASIGEYKLTFHVAANATSGAAPVVSRLLRFP
jgi:hypothetical protein